MEVKIKDRKEDVEFFRIACNMAKINLDYIHADLILKLQERLQKMKGGYAISDSVEIYAEWKEYWDNYFEELTLKKD